MELGPLAWQRNLCMDGDIEPNPGPSTDPIPNPDDGAAFLLAHQRSPFVTLASSSTAPPAPEQRPRKRRAAATPNASSDSEGEELVPHYCPFPSCSKAFSHGFGGWAEKKQLVQHVVCCNRGAMGGSRAG